MSIFGSIVNAIFGSKAAASPSTSPSATSPTSASPQSSAAQAQPLAAGGTSGSARTVDVEAVMNDLAAKNREKLNWRTSIVDLMKLLKLDSSLTSRKQLAKELGYSGSTDDTATMNVWLHKQVMRKLAENGGKVPADLH
jgi:hypothetical protein